MPIVGRALLSHPVAAETAWIAGSGIATKMENPKSEDGTEV